MEKPIVSVIMPVYCGEKYICQAVDSVFAQEVELELIVVDDASPDRTSQVLEPYRKRQDFVYIRNERNMGAAASRNKGVQKAKGRYVAYLDADDIWLPEKLERELAFLKEKDVAFAFTGYEFADENGRGTGKIVHVPETLDYKQALGNTTIFTTTVMFDTQKISKELLEMPVIKSEDTALWWKVLRNGYTAFGLDENLVKYRRPGKSLSSNKLEAVRRIWNLYRKAEGMGVLDSAWHFCFWAVRAVSRRL